MDGRIILATNSQGIARAEADRHGNWTVERRLEGQDVRCAAVSPLEPSVVFAGAEAGGVYRSADFGRTWEPSGLAAWPVKSLAVSPHDPAIVYAGVRPARFFLSRDGGRSWAESEGFRRIPFRWWWFSPAEPPFRAYVQAIAPSPTDPTVVLAGIEFGAVVRSQDGGRTWTGHRRGALRDCHTLKFHAHDGDWAYEAGGTGGGASLSQDGGQSWRKAGEGLAVGYGVTCAADPERPNVWYVAVAPGPGKAYGPLAEGYLYRSSEHGTWEPAGWEDHPMKTMPIALVTDPASSGHLYAGSVGGAVRHSKDFGATWRTLPFNLGGIWLSLLVWRR